MWDIKRLNYAVKHFCPNESAGVNQADQQLILLFSTPTYNIPALKTQNKNYYRLA